MITRIVEKYHLLLALIILSVMFVLGVTSMRGDSAIVDEIAHIPAGYSYLTHGDYRLNPEHPPLLKDMAAFPLLFMHLKFPDNIPAWTTDVNGQWEMGWNFLYHIGNDADAILFWSRLPILLLALVLGFAIYEFCRRHFSAQVGLLALVFYAFSPNILAHARFVTTDLGIAAFTFFAFWTFFVFIERPTRRNIILAGVFFALAQLAKFSAIILVPFFVLLTLIAVIVRHKPKQFKDRAIKYGLWLLTIFVIAFALVWLVYIPHTWNMPDSVQDALIKGSLPGGYYDHYGKLMVAINSLPLMKPIVQYILGVLMVFNRVSSGNITYFLGDVTNQSFALYFPVSFVLKTQIPLLILIVITLGTSIWQYLRNKPLQVWRKFLNYGRNHYIELSFGLFIAFYSYISIKGNLNIGIRHLFPMMPMIFILVAKKTLDIVDHIRPSWHKVYKEALAVGIVLYVATPFLIFPSFVPYINSAFGGGSQASKYLSDSNVDWGQDLKRFADWLHQRPEIDKIAVDYFGGGEPRYYLCDRKHNPDGSIVATADGYACDSSQYLEWHAQLGQPPTKYIAVSETYLVSDIFSARLRGDTGYAWLRAKEPIAKIGNSIYIFKVQD